MAHTPDRGARFDRFPQEAISDAHGAQFDRFNRHTSSPHGPLFDEAFTGDQADAEVHHRLDQIADHIRRLPDHHQRLLCDKLGWTQGDTGKSTSSLPAHSVELDDVHKAQEHDLSSGGAEGDLHGALVESIRKTYGGRLAPVTRPTRRPGTVRDVAGEQAHKTLRTLNELDVAKVRQPRSGPALSRGLQTLRELNRNVDVTKVR